MAPTRMMTKSAVREVTDEFTKTSRSTKWGKWMTSEFDVTVSKDRLDLMFTAMGAKGAAKSKDEFLNKAVPIVMELLEDYGIAVVNDASDDESLGSVSAVRAPAKKVVVTRAASPDEGCSMLTGGSSLSGKSGFMSKSGKTDLTLMQVARGDAMKKVYAQLDKTDIMVEQEDGTKKMWSTLSNGRKLGVVSTIVSQLPEIVDLSARNKAEREAVKAAKAQAKKMKDAEIEALLMANGIDMSKLKVATRSISLKA